MTVREKLELQKAIDLRNAVREFDFLHEIENNAIYESIEYNAKAVFNRIDHLATYYGRERSELFDVLIDTLQALKQIKDQEG